MKDGISLADDGVTSIGSSAREYLKLLILQKRDEAIQEIRSYYYRESRGASVPTHKVKARMLALYLEIYAMLKRSYDEQQFNKLSRMVSSNDIKELTGAFCIMSEFLDLKRLTRFDNKANLDFNDAEGENLYYGL